MALLVGKMTCSSQNASSVRVNAALSAGSEGDSAPTSSKPAAFACFVAASSSLSCAVVNDSMTSFSPSSRNRSSMDSREILTRAASLPAPSLMSARRVLVTLPYRPATSRSNARAACRSISSDCAVVV